MSDRRKHADHKVSLLATQLNNIGIEIPPESEVRLVMKRMQVSFPPYVKAGKLLLLLYEYWDRARGRYEEYSSFTIEEHDQVADDWGGLMPPSIRRMVRLIRERLPHVELKVYATTNDPMIAAVAGDEEIPLGVWYRCDASCPVQRVRFPLGE